MKWRWDQGRMLYLQYDVIRTMAKVLVSLEGVNLNKTDPLRDPLQLATGLPFAPSNYKVWRNYARVFGCSLLATKKQQILLCTDLAHALASSGSNQLGPDEYFTHIIKRFCLPFPSFQGYNVSDAQVFPFCAILKFLVSRAIYSQRYDATVDDIHKYVIANQMNGTEDIKSYINLKPQNCSPRGDETRQLREILRFMSQVSFLQWSNPNIYIDVSAIQGDGRKALLNLATPNILTPKSEIADQILALGSRFGVSIPKLKPAKELTPDLDTSFSEGKKVRTIHLRYERSPKLRDLFFSKASAPYYCDMCRLNVSKRYSWVPNLLELHHLLPLSSPIRVESAKTALYDLVPVCPSCHRSVHIYYRQWLKNNKLDDFRSKNEAIECYEESKAAIGK
jgi:hypothetical protein